MGEIAEGMLDGTLCQCCGGYVGVCEGYPVTCDGCCEYADEPIPPQPEYPYEPNKKFPCPICGVRKFNVAAHVAAKHPERGDG